MHYISVLTSTYELFKNLASYNLSYVYNGAFSQKLTDNILALSETNLNSLEEDSTIKKKVYFILVESLQNITRHQTFDTSIDENTSCFFIIQRVHSQYLITSGNPVENSALNSLKMKL